MHADMQVVSDLGLILGVAVVLALAGARFKIPAVVAYLATGVLLGPPGLGLLADAHNLETLAEVGVVLLLFTIGLEFDLGALRRSWRAIVLGGGLQVLGTVAVVSGFVALTGTGWGSALTWGMLISLSSTAVVLRLLEDRGESTAPHGRLVTGVLIFQDLCIVPMMMMLPVLAGKQEGGAALFTVLLQAAAVVIAVVVGSRIVVPPLMQRVARDTPREVFLLAVLAVGGVVAWAVSLTGLSFALGAFLAGVVLAETQFSHQAMADVLPLRAVMMCVFFVAIGMLLDPAAIVANPLLVLGLFIAIGFVKAAVAAGAFVMLRFPVPTAALAATSLAQVGEFSLVLAGAAAEVDLISSDQERAFLAAALLSIAITPLVTSRAPHIVEGRAIQAVRDLLDGTDAPEIADAEPPNDAHVIIAGLGVGGRTVVEALESVGTPVTLIELNPDTVAAERARGRRVVYGDVMSDEVLHHAGLRTARAVVIVISNFDVAHRAALHISHLRRDVPVMLRTRWAADEGDLRAEGLDVISEEFAGAVTMAGLVLRRLGVAGWDGVVEQQLDDHARLGPQDEGTLGPPPSMVAADGLTRETPPA